ncbi:MAG: RNA polymerase sigma factor RpoD/SigA [Candidatus Omnitrophica bacterium]|nr:RNA polymerase sigma factor RpoD/SigA [Candidatus Omnitrophota bacterium]
MDFSIINHEIYADTPTTPLSASEEREMMRRFQKGDMDARRRLIESNLRFVIKMALNYRNKGLSLADLIQEGNLGLIEALEKFDPSKKCRLITYASWWIRLFIQRALEQKTHQINLPINKGEILRKIRYCEEMFLKTHGRNPTVQEISDETGLDADKIEEIMNNALSFQTLHACDEDHPGWESILVDEQSHNPRETLCDQEAWRRLCTAMEVLNHREREVLIRRYRIFEGGKRLSLRKVGQSMGLSAEGVRRIEEQAMIKLRRPNIRRRMASLFAA